jgi:hypothetical protein
MPSSYVYQRRGGPLLDWASPSGRPPSQSRAADATALGAWAPIRPGAPEVIGGDLVMTTPAAGATPPCKCPNIPMSYLFAASLFVWWIVARK